MMLAPPSASLTRAIDALRRFVLANATTTNEAPYDGMLGAAGQEPQDETPLDRVVRRVLLSMLEERRTRQPQATRQPSVTSLVVS